MGVDGPLTSPLEAGGSDAGGDMLEGDGRAGGMGHKAMVRGTRALNGFTFDEKSELLEKDLARKVAGIL